jgi:hypothetical protein
MRKATPVKYAQTTVDPTQSAMQLSALVQRYGGTRFELRWDQGLLTGVRFAIAHPALGEIPVRLQARIQEVEARLRKARPWHRRMRKSPKDYEREVTEQAYRMAWRHLRDLCEQLLVATSLGVIEIHEGFLWAVEAEDPVTGVVTTFGDLLAHHTKAIGAGGALRLLPAEATYEIEPR